MTQQKPEIPLLIVGEKDLLIEIHNSLKDNEAIIKLDNIKKAEENLQLNFTLGDVADFITVIKEIAPPIASILMVITTFSKKKNKKKFQRIILKTPKGSIEITSDSKIEEVLEQLKSKI